MHISGGIVAQEPTPIGGVGNRPDGGPAYQGHQMTSMQTRDRRRCHEELSRRNSAPPAGREHRGVSLAAAPESARAARDFTTPALRGWRPEPLIPDAVAAASELVTDQLRHGTRCAADGAEARHDHIPGRTGNVGTRRGCRRTDAGRGCPMPPALLRRSGLAPCAATWRATMQALASDHAENVLDETSAGRSVT